jgi:hypothetical protein
MYYFVIEGPNALGSVLLFLVEDKGRRESGPVGGRAGAGVGRHGGPGKTGKYKLLCAKGAGGDMERGWTGGQSGDVWSDEGRGRCCRPIDGSVEMAHEAQGLGRWACDQCLQVAAFKFDES